MADLTTLNFDPAQTEDMGDCFKVLPPGHYNVVIVESAVNNTKAGNGKLLELKYQVIEGAHTGDTLTDRLNLVNPSELAQKIGLSQLKHICDAVGYSGQLKDSNQLHGRPFTVKVTVEEFESKDGKILQSNKIEKRMPKQTAQAAQASTAPAAVAGAAAQADGARLAVGW